MPYFRDESELEFDKDSEPPPARLEEFHYITPWDPDRDHASRPSVPLHDAPTPSAEGGGLLARLRGLLARRASVPGPRTRPESEGPLRALLETELRGVGVTSVYCRIDGGNDEGFAWLDSARTADGRRLLPGEVVELLVEHGAAERLPEAAPHSLRGEEVSPHDLLMRQLEWDVVETWATRLHGVGFGTGEYSMYGAFTVDLVAGTITDDPDADPVVQNIEIQGT